MLKKTINLKAQILLDFKQAKQKFELYNQFYLGLSEDAKQYLKKQSAEYKDILLDLQQIILPAVLKICPECKIQCCKLHTPELSIYIAGAVGGFKFVDYLLARCDTILPTPNYGNAEKNICPFFKDGCILPANCRSYLCVQYFCDDLKSQIDMQTVSKFIEKLELLIKKFSIAKCMR